MTAKETRPIETIKEALYVRICCMTKASFSIRKEGLDLLVNDTGIIIL